MQRSHIDLLLRGGIAFALIYPAVSAFFAPEAWIGYFPPFVRDVLGSDTTLLYTLHLFGLLEVTLGIWILAGKKIFAPATATAVILFLIVVFNFSLLDVLFRDIPIMLTAMALALMHRTDA